MNLKLTLFLLIFEGGASIVQRYHYGAGLRWWNFVENVPGGHRWHKFGWTIMDSLDGPKGYTTTTDS